MRTWCNALDVGPRERARPAVVRPLEEVGLAGAGCRYDGLGARTPFHSDGGPELRQSRSVTAWDVQPRLGGPHASSLGKHSAQEGRGTPPKRAGSSQAQQCSMLGSASRREQCTEQRLVASATSEYMCAMHLRIPHTHSGITLVTPNSAGACRLAQTKPPEQRAAVKGSQRTKPHLTLPTATLAPTVVWGAPTRARVPAAPRTTAAPNRAPSWGVADAYSLSRYPRDITPPGAGPGKEHIQDTQLFQLCHNQMPIHPNPFILQLPSPILYLGTPCARTRNISIHDAQQDCGVTGLLTS
jgi:hypothetical protein